MAKKNRPFKGFVPNYANLELVKSNLSDNFAIPRADKSRNRDIISKILLHEVPTEAVAAEYGLSLRMTQTIVTDFLKNIGYKREIKQQSMQAHKRLGVERQPVYDLYECRCAICDFTYPQLNGGGCTVHHIVEVCDGGTHEIDNLILACPNCHMLIHRGVISQEKLHQIQKDHMQKREALSAMEGAASLSDAEQIKQLRAERDYYKEKARQAKVSYDAIKQTRKDEIEIEGRRKKREGEITRLNSLCRALQSENDRIVAENVGLKTRNQKLFDLLKDEYPPSTAD